MDLSDATSATLEFNFWNTEWGSSINILNVYYRVDEDSWSTLATYSQTTNGWTPVTITLTGLDDNYQIGFQCINHYSHGTGIDDVKVTAEYSLTWTTVSNDAESPYTFSDLTPETTYSVRVTGDCGSEGLSQPSNEVSFTTLEICPVPSDLNIDENTITVHQASLAWTADNDSYNIMLGESLSLTADFETGDFSQADFTTNEGDLAWTVVENTHSGTYCAKSASGQHSSTSALELPVTMENDGTLSFSATKVLCFTGPFITDTDSEQWIWSMTPPTNTSAGTWWATPSPARPRSTSHTIC